MLKNFTLRLETDKKNVNYINPWAVGTAYKSGATVTILRHEEKIYLVTNAHAVQKTTYLKVKFNQGAIELPVEPVWVDPVMDVAILKTNSPEAEELIKKNTNAIEINPIFQPASTEVSAYGYPAGGKGLSFTKGYISRTEISQIALSKLPGITVQTSAPINPGNSGGPITIKQDLGVETCIGIVSQGSLGLNSTGYFIPARIIIQSIENYERFKKLKEKKFIDYVTVPNISFKWQSLKNISLRKALGMETKSLGEELTGILVSSVPKNSCAYHHLKEEDIIIQIDGYDIHVDGNVQVPELEHPISYLYLIQSKKYLDEIQLNILRKDSQGILQEQTITFRLNEQLGRSILGINDDKPLKYHIQPSGKNGAFVFVRCTQALMNTFVTHYPSGQKTIVDKSAVPAMFADFENLFKSDELSEIVVLQNILASEETDGYDDLSLDSGAFCESHRVVEVNGIPIRSLFDLIDVFAQSPEKTSLVKFENGKIIAIAPEEINAKNELQSRYQIAFFTSPKVAPIPKKLFLDELNALRTEDETNIIPSSMF